MNQTNYINEKLDQMFAQINPNASSTNELLSQINIYKAIVQELLSKNNQLQQENKDLINEMTRSTKHIGKIYIDLLNSQLNLK